MEMMTPPGHDLDHGHDQDLRRPGGLTALGVLNIVFAIVGLLGGLALLAVADGARRHGLDGIGGYDDFARVRSRELVESFMTKYSPGAFQLMFGLGLAGGLAMLIAAFGFFGQRRFSGRTLGNLSSILIIASALVAVTQLGFMFMGVPMCGAIYAIVVLSLINTIYAKRLVN